MVHVGRVNGTLQFAFEVLTLEAYGDVLPVARSQMVQSGELPIC